MQTPTRKPDWNELDFLSWDAFRRMAPPVLRLEITRIERLLAAEALPLDVHNALVRVRFALNTFLTCLAGSDRTTFDGTCVPHLDAALLNLPLAFPDLDAPTRETLAYVLDRLRYIHDRIRLIY